MVLITIVNGVYKPTKVYMAMALQWHHIWQCVKTSLYPFCSHQNSWVKMDVNNPLKMVFLYVLIHTQISQDLKKLLGWAGIAVARSPGLVKNPVRQPVPHLDYAWPSRLLKLLWGRLIPR